MTMNTEQHKKDASAMLPSGRRYASVDELMKGEGVPADFQTKVSEIRSQTSIVQQLTILRHLAGLTQEEMGHRLGIGQSAVSKLETGQDDDLTIGQIKSYAQVSGERIAMFFGKPLNHVEAVKIAAIGMRQHLSALAALAQQGGEDMEKQIQAFFGEAFFNILDILSKCQNQMPNPKAIEVRVEISRTEKPVGARLVQSEANRELAVA